MPGALERVRNSVTMALRAMLGTYFGCFGSLMTTIDYSAEDVGMYLLPLMLMK